jgi:hypothetical protein
VLFTEQHSKCFAPTEIIALVVLDLKLKTTDDEDDEDFQLSKVKYITVAEGAANGVKCGEW